MDFLTEVIAVSLHPSFLLYVNPVAKLEEGKWCVHPQQQNPWGGKMNILNGKKSWFSIHTKF